MKAAMGPCSALVASILAILVPGTVFLKAEGQIMSGSTPLTPSARLIPPMEIVEDGPLGRVVIDWTGSGSLNVAVVVAPPAKYVVWRASLPFSPAAITSLHPAPHPGPSGSAVAETGQPREILIEHSHIPFMRASAAWDAGRALVEGGQLADAITVFRGGIEALGDRYKTPELIDDTGTKATLAEMKRKAGDLTTAAVLYDRVLEARISAYRDRFHLPPRVGDGK